MEKEKTMNYEAPRIEVIEVEVEKGFAASDGDYIKSLPIEEWS